MNLKKLSAFFLIHAFTSILLFSKDYNVLDFGAVGDGSTLCTAAIQSAIDKANKDGGGKVVIPNGDFLSGSIILKSGVNLYLESKATLLGSTQDSHYVKLHFWKALILADSANDISISGKGTIDGQGAQLALNIDSLFYVGKIDSTMYELKERRPKAPLRPQIIEIRNSTNVTVKGVTIKNSASWVQTYHLCNQLLIDDIHVDSDAYWNNDGIDLIDCKNVKIINSYINASDDGICLKSQGMKGYEDAYCDSIYIANCKIRSSASAIKFGTWSYTGFKNITIEHIKVFDTFRSAVALEVVHGGFIEDIVISNIKASNTGNAVFIRLGDMSRKFEPGRIKNVSIKNVKVKVPFEVPDLQYDIRGPALPFFHNTFPASITGLPGHQVQNVALENVQVIYPGKGNKAYAYAPISRLDNVAENADKYPEFSMFGELPAWGFYLRHVNGLTLKDVKVKIRQPDYRPAFVFDDVNELKLENVEIKGDDKKRGYIFHRTVQPKNFNAY